MYAVRLYKDYDNSKILGFRVVDSTTNVYQEFSYDDMKQILKNKTYNIKNVELDSYGNPRLKNMNPDRKIRYYKQNYVDNITVNHYCIITGYSNGFLDFIADSCDESECNIHSGKEVTLGAIANLLKIDDIDELKLYNAKIEKEQGTYRIWVFKGGTYRKLPLIHRDFSKKDYLISEWKNGKFSNDEHWTVNIQSIEEEGIRANYLEHKEPVGEATIPEYIAHLEQFGGNVNHVKIPRTLKSLGERCFEELEDLISVKIGPGVKIIPDKCFMDSSLQSVRFSSRELEIGHDAFADCDQLKCQIITNAVRIGIRAFYNSGIHKAILYRAGMINAYTFKNCERLVEVKLFNGLKYIGKSAFENCIKLQTINIPSTVTIIEESAFKGCKNLKIARVPKGIKVGKDAFPNNTTIEYY